MSRPHEAPEARRPAPLVQTRRADTFSLKRIPRSPASAVEIFRMIDIPTHPRVGSPRVPLTQRTPDAGNLDRVDLLKHRLRKILRLVAKAHAL